MKRKCMLFLLILFSLSGYAARLQVDSIGVKYQYGMSSAIDSVWIIPLSDKMGSDTFNQLLKLKNTVDFQISYNDTTLTRISELLNTFKKEVAKKNVNLSVDILSLAGKNKVHFNMPDRMKLNPSQSSQWLYLSVRDYSSDPLMSRLSDRYLYHLPNPENYRFLWSGQATHYIEAGYSFDDYFYNDKDGLYIQIDRVGGK